ncbi:MAG: alkaline phosphatase family protein, partial [Ardenticatenaceae bacterium]
MGKIIVLGIDGADWSLIERWHERYLPGFNRLMELGVSGPLKSINPPTTCPAWWAWATGKDPSTLGVFDFANKPVGTTQLDFVNSTAFQDYPIWKLIEQDGRRSAVIHMPVTFPPQPLNGVMVTGIMTPSHESQFTFPTSLQQDLLNHFPEYPFDIDRARLSSKEAFRAQARITRIQQEAIRWLWAREEYDLFVAVLMAVDRIQHLFWTEQDLRAESADTEAILETYRVMDSWVAEWLERRRPDDYLIVLSDHGGQHCCGRFHINEWLRREGYLHQYMP